MRLTHLGHACVLVEAASTRLLLDPGVYSADFTTLTELDAVLLTHQHADHADQERLPALLDANPGARVVAEPQTADILRELGRESPVIASFTGDSTTTVGSLTVRGVGELHAFNHDGVPRCGNTGFLISAEGEPTLLHPGDAYDGQPGGKVDVLLLPLNAPWTAVRETLEFLHRVTPRHVVPIHEGLLSDAGRDSYLMHVQSFGPDGATVEDLSSGQPWDVR